MIIVKGLSTMTFTTESKFQFSEKGKMGVSPNQGPTMSSSTSLHSGMRERERTGLSQLYSVSRTVLATPLKLTQEHPKKYTNATEAYLINHV